MKMLLNGEWVAGTQTDYVLNPQDNTVVDSVPHATEADMLAAIESAVAGFEHARHLPVHERMRILQQAADNISAEHEDFLRTIASEGIKSNDLTEYCFSSGSASRLRCGND